MFVSFTRNVVILSTFKRIIAYFEAEIASSYYCELLITSLSFVIFIATIITNYLFVLKYSDHHFRESNQAI